jgi:hypothetical protein
MLVMPQFVPLGRLVLELDIDLLGQRVDPQHHVRVATAGSEELPDLTDSYLTTDVAACSGPMGPSSGPL